jgi:hypothetical protein
MREATLSSSLKVSTMYWKQQGLESNKKRLIQMRFTLTHVFLLKGDRWRAITHESWLERRELQKVGDWTSYQLNESRFTSDA